MILAETFGLRLSEVDETIRQRCKRKEQWPENFWLDAEYEPVSAVPSKVGRGHKDGQKLLKITI
jgi:hypothetical protein